MPTWPTGDPRASTYPEAKTGTYRNKLGAVLPPGRDTMPEISLRFSVGNLELAVDAAATSSVDKLVSRTGRNLKRAGYSVQKPYPAEFAGLADGRGRVVTKKKKRRRAAGQPLLMLYAVPGPYSVMLTVPQREEGLITSFGPVTVEQAAPPAIVPIVRVGVPDVSAVAEELKLTEPRARLTAMITRDPVTVSTDEFAMSTLQKIMRGLKGAAVNEGQPDMFLGGQYCIRHTFVLGGTAMGTPVRSEYWWAGVVAGHGVQIFVVGTRSIIDMNQARGLKDAVVLIPPG